MNTSRLLIENLIQGFQTITWVLLLVLSCTGYSIDLKLSEIPPSYIVIFSFISISVIYYVGIIVDTLYYNLIIQRWEGNWASIRKGENGIPLTKMIIKISMSNDYWATWFAKKQDHLRMIRVSSVNLIFILAALNIFILLQIANDKLMYIGLVTAFGALLIFLTTYTWKKLYYFYYSMAEQCYEVIVDNK